MLTTLITAKQSIGCHSKKRTDRFSGFALSQCCQLDARWQQAAQLHTHRAKSLQVDIKQIFCRRQSMQISVGSKKDSAVTKAKLYMPLSANGFPRSSFFLFWWLFCLLMKQIIRNKWNVRKPKSRTTPYTQVTFLLSALSSHATDPPLTLSLPAPALPAPASGETVWWEAFPIPHGTYYLQKDYC